MENALGRLALAAGRVTLAEKHARSAIEADPEATSGHVLLGLVLQKKGDPAGAIVAFETALAKGSKDFEVYFELAFAEQNAGGGDSSFLSISPEKARRIATRYERAIVAYPRFRPAYENLGGIISVVEATNDQDRQLLEIGHKLFPDAGMITLGLAILAKKSRDDTKALSLLSQVLESKGQRAEVKSFADYLDTAWQHQDIQSQIAQLEKMGKLDEAIQLIDSKLEIGVNFQMRAALASMRRQLKTNARNQIIRQALAERRLDDARRLIVELLDSDAPAEQKATARRALDEMDRHGLGVPPQPKS